MQYISSLPQNSYANHFPRKISICGSTGSIGVNTLKIIGNYPDLFQPIALGAGKNIVLLSQQAVKFKPQYLVVQEENLLEPLKDLIKDIAGYKPVILVGQEGYEEIASIAEVDVFVSAQVGASGLRSTFAAAKAGKIVCLANKESLVLAGGLLREVCMQTGASILPIDSEHHALFQCLCGHEAKDVQKLILTASGGALRTKSYDFLQNARAEDALKHPNWSMGAKITIDSASLMNKGLEVIEACQLYGMDLSSVEVLIHPQSIIHSMVEYKDNSCIAQLSTPDMRLPIAHCIAYPLMLEAEKCDLPKLDLIKLGQLTFEEVNNKHFPCLEIAKQAFRERKCVALNAANEVVVEAFLGNKIRFMQIPSIIEEILVNAQKDPASIGDILAFDSIYREQSYTYIKNL